MGWNSNLLTKPIGLGDISVATGIGGPPYSLGNMIASSNNINKMAVYKPVKSSNPGELTYAERKATRFGFGTALPQLNLSDNEPQNDWVYQKPTAGAPNEWFRALDFDGYASDACAPIAVGIGQLTYEDWSQVLVFVNGLSNSIRTDGKRWVEGQSLSIEELLSGGSDYYGAYVAFVIVDTQTWEKNLVVTNKTFRALVNDNYGIFQLRAQQATDSGLVYPSIPILSSSRIGRTFRVIVCLTPGMQPQQGYAYAVYSSNVSSYIPYSIGFVSGADRASAVLGSGAFVMDGTTITSLTLDKVDMVTEAVVGGITWRKWRITAKAVLDTTNRQYSGRTITITGQITLSANYTFGPTPDSGNNTISPAVAANDLVGGTAGQERYIFASDDSNYLWVPVPGQGLPGTTVTASLVFDYPFNNPISNPSPNPTIQVP